MYSSNKHAFTVTEVLLTVVVVGILALLVLPGLVKDMNEKSRMSLLKTTLISLDDAIHKEISQQRIEDITLTTIHNNPAAFFEHFDRATSADAFAASYRNNSGQDVTVTIPENHVLLKNGVGIGVVSRLFNKNSTGVVIDVTGSTPPNVVGVDYFIAEIAWEEDTTKGIFVGDLHGYFNGAAQGEEETFANLKSNCNAGSGAACFRLAELSGYNPKYLEE